MGEGRGARGQQSINQQLAPTAHLEYLPPFGTSGLIQLTPGKKRRCQRKTLPVVM